MFSSHLCYISFLWSLTLGDVRTSTDSSNEIYADLSTGRIRGRKLRTGNGNTANLFLGVPYAEPPIGNLRFRPPVPKKPWEGILECVEYGPACLQNSSITSTPQNVISEDCLQLNVLVNPQCSTSSPCAVLHFIHGGAWYFDSPRQFPLETQIDNFVSKGVIFISVSYREGTFAFWNTGSPDAIGNYGMYDMVESLRWVQREIRNFGGDPTTVTTLGYSSSSTAISQLSLSPMLKGLYHQSILMSGTAMGTTFNDFPKVNMEFAVRAGCATPAQWKAGDLRNVAECMRKKDGRFLLTVQRSLDADALMYSGPRQDGQLFAAPMEELIKDRHPYNLVVGSTLYEFAVPVLVSVFPEDLGKAGLKLACRFSAGSFHFHHQKKISSLCFDFYSSHNKESKAMAAVELLLGENMFVSTYGEAKSMASAGAQSYLYSFDYVKKGMEGMAPFHAQDVFFIFGVHADTFPTPPDARDRHITQLPRICSQILSNMEIQPRIRQRCRDGRHWNGQKATITTRLISLHKMIHATTAQICNSGLKRLPRQIKL